MNIAPRTAVFLAIFSVTCGSALSIAVANANNKLASLGWLIVPLFSLGGFFLLLAIVTAFRPTAEQLRLRREEKKKSLRRTIRDLKREYRATHHIGTAFVLGAEYYIQRTSSADAELIHEIIEEGGEKEF